MAEAWHAWFDGSALPNPGRIGIGIVLQAPDGSRQTQACLPRASGCNNEAELQALCATLQLAQAAGARVLHVYGDSDVAVRYVTGVDTTTVVRLQPWIAHAQSLLGEFETAELHWVPRHRNQEADTLSRQALGLAPKPPRSKNR